MSNLDNLKFAKFVYDSFDLGLRQFWGLPQLSEKTLITQKVVKTDSKLIILLRQSKSVCALHLHSGLVCLTEKNVPNKFAFAATMMSFAKKVLISSTFYAHILH